MKAHAYLARQSKSTIEPGGQAASRHRKELLSQGAEEWVLLVDRFRVVVFPVITGSTGQERIYDGYPDVALDMISSRTFDGRIQLLEYSPTVLDGPPAVS